MDETSTRPRFTSNAVAPSDWKWPTKGICEADGLSGLQPAPVRFFKFGDEELLLKLGASEETIQSVRRLRAAEAENQKDYKSLPPEAPAKVDLAVADLAGIEEFSDEITIKYLAGQLSIEEFDELQKFADFDQKVRHFGFSVDAFLSCCSSFFRMSIILKVTVAHLSMVRRWAKHCRRTAFVHPF